MSFAEVLALPGEIISYYMAYDEIEGIDKTEEMLGMISYLIYISSEAINIKDKRNSKPLNFMPWKNEQIRYLKYKNRNKNDVANKLKNKLGIKK